MKKGKMQRDWKTRREGLRFVEIDTAITRMNIRRDSLVSIRAGRMEGGRVIVRDTFRRPIDPVSSATADSVLIREITSSEVDLRPASGMALPEMFDYCGKGIMALPLEFA